MSDYVCTSSNAVAVVNSIPRNTPIIFGPDRNLGRWVIGQTHRDMVLWPGTCVVHETFNEKHLVKLAAEHPDAEVLAHPECEAPVLRHAHLIGSTKKLLDHTRTSPRPPSS